MGTIFGGCVSPGRSVRWTEVEPVRFCCWGNSPMVGQENHQNPYEIELPQSIIDSFARFLAPEIQKLFASEEGRKELETWKKKYSDKSEE